MDEMPFWQTAIVRDVKDVMPWEFHEEVKRMYSWHNIARRTCKVVAHSHAHSLAAHTHAARLASWPHPPGLLASPAWPALSHSWRGCSRRTCKPHAAAVPVSWPLVQGDHVSNLAKPTSWPLIRMHLPSVLRLTILRCPSAFGAPRILPCPPHTAPRHTARRP